MAPGWARTRESETGLFGYTERGFDENEPTQPLDLELWKGNQRHVHMCRKGTSPG